LPEDIERIHEILRQKDKARESSIRQLRLLIRTCGDGIRALHRGDLRSAKQSIKEGARIADQVAEDLKKHPDLYHSSMVTAGLTEYAELTMVFKLLTKKRIPDMDEIDVPPAAYLNGMGDAIGEMRRHILDLLRRRQTKEAEEYLEIAENMHNLLMGFDYPKALVGDLRRRLDVARSLLEKTRADVTNAVLQEDLSRKLEAFRG